MEKKFNVGKSGGNIDKDIEKLKKELDGFFAGGAPDIQKIEDKLEKKKFIKKKPEEKKQKPEKVEEKPKDEKPTKTAFSPPPPQKPNYYQKSGKSFNLFKSSKFYILVFSIAAFFFLVFRAPVFRYTTPFRPDHDLPQLDVGFRYYNNVLGRQTKAETVLRIGSEQIVIPFGMEEWVNMDPERKLFVIKYYME